MVRITVNGENAQFSSKFIINPNIRDTKANRVIGKSNQIKQLNAALESIKATLFLHYR